ncbi:hypothetical protein GCM10020000_79880 [Streptomyces olivoverticillatus]
MGTKPFWEQITSGRSATRSVSLFDATGYRSQIAGEVDFDPIGAGLSPHQAETLDRMIQFALVGLTEAVADSGIELDALAPARIGVSVGTAVGLTMGLEREYAKVSNHGREWLVDHTLAADTLFDNFIPSSLAREVAWAAGAEGPATVVSTGCTSGLDAVGYALDLIREGSVDVVITGGPPTPPVADHLRVLRRPAGHLPGQPRPGRGMPAVRPDTQRIRPRRGSRRLRSGERGPCPSARRAHLRRARRVRHPVQRLPHDRAAAGRS